MKGSPAYVGGDIFYDNNPTQFTDEDFWEYFEDSEEYFDDEDFNAADDDLEDDL